MSLTSNMSRLFVAVASAHDVQNPIGTYSNGSYVDSSRGVYFGPDIFQHARTVAQLVKRGVIEYSRDAEYGEVIRFDDRRDVLAEFARGVIDAEDGISEEDGLSDASMPLAYQSGLKFARMRMKHGGMAFRLDQGRVCHGMICVDTGERWTQD
ncbi:MAG: hypothetical protein [Bacteriophage sp.]|nr:MAG: hypothetical protein [Bacteriophage sp.]